MLKFGAILPSNLLAKPFSASIEITGDPVSSSRSALKKFLDEYCPDPVLVAAAIDRLGYWDIREIGPDEYLCHADDRAEACWIIVSGQAEIVDGGKSIAFRSVGEMLGEQAFLTTLLGKGTGRRTADILARGSLKFVCLDASLQEKMNPEERAAWSLTLAAVVNKKLTQATRQRAEFRKLIADRDSLLSRFGEGDALGVVRKAMEEESTPVVSRELIIWFSDIANFSTWAVDKPPEEVARLARALTGRQIEHIRAAGGQIDKLMGDGVMAIWFVDTADRRSRLPTAAVECARKVAAEVGALLESEKLDKEMAIRIGLHSGCASFGDFGSQQRIAITVLSHDVNLASRYEQAKLNGLDSVRVSPSLKALVEASSIERDWAFGNPTTVQVKHGVEIEIYSPEQKDKSR
jgi:class 3 adenylate cyclase